MPISAPKTDMTITVTITVIVTNMLVSIAIRPNTPGIKKARMDKTMRTAAIIAIIIIRIVHMSRNIFIRPFKADNPENITDNTIV